MALHPLTPPPPSHPPVSSKWCLAATSESQCGVSPDGMSSRSSSVSLTASQQWSGSRDEITQALRNICVPLGKYHEMRPHYAAEIHCSSAKSIPSRAGHKKPLNVLIRSERNSGRGLFKWRQEERGISMTNRCSRDDWANFMRNWYFWYD